MCCGKAAHAIGSRNESSGVAESPVILSEGFAASVTDPCKSELPLDTVCWCWLCQE